MMHTGKKKNTTPAKYLEIGEVDLAAPHRGLEIFAADILHKLAQILVE